MLIIIEPSDTQVTILVRKTKGKCQMGDSLGGECIVYQVRDISTA